MLLLLQLLACDPELKTLHYDISSTIVVTDDHGVQIDLEDVEFCQRFQSEDYNTQTSWHVQSEQCEFVDIEHGFAVLPNWEGEYFGPDVSIVVDMKFGDEIFTAELMDNDMDVWCDNQVLDSIDHETGTPTYKNMCDENFERYLLWTLVVPSQVIAEYQNDERNEPADTSDAEDEFQDTGGGSTE